MRISPQISLYYFQLLVQLTFTQTSDQKIYFYCISLFDRDQLAQPEKPASPKFIVTLDGVPSPPGYLSDQEEEDMCITEGLKPVTQNMCAGKGLKGLRAQQMQIVTRQLESCDGNYAYQQDLTLDGGLIVDRTLGYIILKKSK